MRAFKENKYLVIRDSRNGKGVFTKRPFAAEEKIFEITGAFVTCNEDDDMDEQTRSNTYRYDEDLYISPAGKIGDYLNHSCNPNAKVSKRGKKLFIDAIKAIPEGREVLIDYSTIIASDDSWMMRCNCGSADCRGKIGMFKRLPEAIKEKYRRRSIVPDYILEL